MRVALNALWNQEKGWLSATRALSLIRDKGVIGLSEHYTLSLNKGQRRN